MNTHIGSCVNCRAQQSSVVISVYQGIINGSIAFLPSSKAFSSLLLPGQQKDKRALPWTAAVLDQAYVVHAKQILGHLVFTLLYEQGLNQHLLCHIHDTNYTLLESAKALFRYIYRKYPYAVLPEIFMQITMLVETLLEYAICMLWSEFLTRSWHDL